MSIFEIIEEYGPMFARRKRWRKKREQAARVTDTTGEDPHCDIFHLWKTALLVMFFLTLSCFWEILGLTTPEDRRGSDEETPDYYVPRSVYAASSNVFGSHRAFYTTAWDARRRKWVTRDSRPPPLVLCQVQEEPLNREEFEARRATVGKFLANTGAQVNCANRSIFKLMGIRGRGNQDEYLRDMEVGGDATG